MIFWGPLLIKSRCCILARSRAGIVVGIIMGRGILRAAAVLTTLLLGRAGT